MVDACRETQTNNYGDLVKKVIGPKAGFFINFVFIVQSFGFLPVFLLVWGIILVLQVLIIEFSSYIF